MFYSHSVSLSWKHHNEVSYLEQRRLSNYLNPLFLSVYPLRAMLNADRIQYVIIAKMEPEIA